MITNINYKGHIAPHEMKRINFPHYQKPSPPPHQKIYTLDKGVKLLIFSSGKCRLMGLKEPIGEEKFSHLPFMARGLQIQLSNMMPKKERIFEPELFPALRLTKYKPLCVNVFASGKIVIFGLKKLTNQNLLSKIRDYIRSYL
jgi:TATA-box binding protein (TBP) (component of TFIID and TFIIIB)